MPNASFRYVIRIMLLTLRYVMRWLSPVKSASEVVRRSVYEKLRAFTFAPRSISVVFWQCLNSSIRDKFRAFTFAPVKSASEVGEVPNSSIRDKFRTITFTPVKPASEVVNSSVCEQLRAFTFAPRSISVRLHSHQSNQHVLEHVFAYTSFGTWQVPVSHQLYVVLWPCLNSSPCVYIRT